MKTINIAKDFSPDPGFRYRKTALFSGEEFRDNLLIPALEEGNGVCLDLNGLYFSLTAAFVEEAFGGAVRRGFQLSEENLKLVTENEYLKSKIWNSIKKAAAH